MINLDLKPVPIFTADLGSDGTCHVDFNWSDKDLSVQFPAVAILDLKTEGVKECQLNMI